MAVGSAKSVRMKIRYGKETIPVAVSFSTRKRLNITVHPDQSVVVKAPSSETIERVMEAVNRRAPWIYKQRRHFEQFTPLPMARQYVSGETFIYLGRQYRLRVNEDDDESVKLIGRYLIVSTANKLDSGQVKVLVDEWYMGHAKGMLTARFEKCLATATSLKIDPPKLRIRHMLRSWGTCSSKGWINLNSELVKTPVYCIDYVITHELCHLRYRNHSPAFYRLLGRCLPDWQQRKARLDRYVI